MNTNHAFNTSTAVWRGEEDTPTSSSTLRVVPLLSLMAYVLFGNGNCEIEVVTLSSRRGQCHSPNSTHTYSIGYGKRDNMHADGIKEK